MSAVRTDSVLDEYNRPVPGATIYVYKDDGTAAVLTSDGTTPLAQPVTTNEFGVYSYYAVPAIYREDIWFSGKLRYQAVTPVGLDGIYPAAPRGGMFFAFDAGGNPVAASGTGADAALRTDLAANSGFTLIKYKNADANAFARSGAQLKAMGAEESDGLSLIHFIDPAYDAALIANAAVPALDTAFTNALANLATVQASTGRKTRLLLPGFVYPVAASLNFNVQDMVVDGGKAAKITSSLDGKAFGLNGAGSVLRGIHFDQAATGADPAPYFEHNGANSIIEDNIFTRTATAHIPCYVREAAAGGRFLRNLCTWYGGVNLISNVKDYALCFNSFINPVGSASDDAIAIKAIAGQSSHILVGWNYFDGMADMVGIGSECGQQGANDATHSNTIEGVVIVGNRGRNLSYGLFIKPGAVDGVDYRDGRVRGIIYSDNEVRDDQGTNLQTLIRVSVGRGARVEGVTGKNNKAIGRCKTGSSNLIGQWIYIRDDTGVGSSASSIDGVDVGFELIDPYFGVAAGGSAPGAPWANVVSLDRQTTGVGTATRITVDCAANGTSGSGVSIIAGYDGAHIRRARLSNVNTGASTAPAGVAVTASAITIGTDVQLDMLLGYPYKVTSGASIACPELAENVFLFDKTAGTAATVFPWAAKRRSQLIKAKIVTTNTVVASDTNYTSLTLKNKSGTDATFAAARTKVTPAGGNDIAIGLTLGLTTTIYDFTSLTLDTQRTQTLFAEGQTLHIDKAETGTGAALSDARLVVFPLPY